MIELDKQTNLDALQHEINRLRRAIRDCDKTHRIMPSPQLIMLEDRHNLLRSALSEIESFRRNQRSSQWKPVPEKLTEGHESEYNDNLVMDEYGDIKRARVAYDGREYLWCAWNQDASLRIQPKYVMELPPPPEEQ